MISFKRIELGVYNEVIYFIDSDPITMIEAHNKLFDDPIDKDYAGYGGGCFNSKLNGKDMVVIWVEDKKHIPHEAMHATQIIMKYVGIPLCDETSEAYAYLLGYIVDKCKDKVKSIER